MLGVGAVVTVSVGAGHGCGHQRWSCQEKERTHMMSIDTLDQETDRLRRREELGVLVVMATSSSLMAAEGGPIGQG